MQYFCQCLRNTLNGCDDHGNHGAAYYCSKDKRLAAALLDAPFTRGELGALLPPGNKNLRDYINGFIAKARKNGRLEESMAEYLHNTAAK